ncbi:MAG: Bug family tripartite tricarboxylate transporter substrate binding protein, partial [Thermomicrobiales bacterium]
MTQILRSMLAAILIGGPVSAVNAQADAKFPTRAVTIVSPSAPGGSYSIYAQLLANGLEKRLGQPFIVENKPGAGTVTGTNQVAKAEASGHTRLMGATPGLAINVNLRKSIPYDVKKELTPVALFASAHQVLMVNADLPIHSVADIARIAKEKPGSLKFASNGPGTVVHFAGETLKSMLGVDLLHVPYKGIAPAINDVAAGHVSMIFTSIASAGTMLNSGRVRLLGVTSPKRLTALPDVPPLSEVGLPGFDVAL